MTKDWMDEQEEITRRKQAFYAAQAKAREIASDKVWMQVYANDPDIALTLLAKRLGVEIHSTGGGVDVVLVPVTEHSCIAFSNIAENDCGFYYSPDYTDPYDIFWEWQQNGINESLPLPEAVCPTCGLPDGQHLMGKGCSLKDTNRD